MSAEESVRAGRLEEALVAAQDQVRKDPANAKHRVLLFQLLSVLGRWDKALTQLKVLADLDASTLSLAQAYRELLRCEGFRAQVFEGKQAPTIFGEPGPWVAPLLESCKHLAAGRVAEAEALRAQALELAPTTSGAIDGRPFTWIADADPRFGPVLEAVVNGRYFWVPFHRLRMIALEAPTDLRDFVWTPATLQLASGAEVVAFVPTRYPGTEGRAEGALLLARRTEWVERGPETHVGFGQRMLATDEGEVALLDARLITLAGAEGVASEGADDGAAPPASTGEAHG